MNLQRQVLFWLGALLFVLLFVWVFRDVLLPFVAGIALAYFLNPLADKLEKQGLNRVVAALLITGLFVLFFVLIAIILIPLLGSQLFSFIQQIPTYITRLQELVLTEENQEWVKRMLGTDTLNLRATVGELVGQGANWLGTFMQGLWSGGRALISLFAVAVVMPVVALYVLIDWHRMVNKVDSWLPVRHRETIRGLARQIDAALAGFIRGQGLVTLILGSFYAVGLTFAGLNFGLLIGIGAGVLSYIPYVGSFTGLLIAGGVAFAQFWPDWVPIASVLGIFFFGQFVEGYILQPKLVGDRVGLHPVWLMFALFAFGYLLGFVGVLLAVPLAAATGVLVRFALKQYLASPLYTGGARKQSEKSGR